MSVKFELNETEKESIINFEIKLFAFSWILTKFWFQALINEIKSQKNIFMFIWREYFS